jgi:hypothetical protein
VRAGSWVSLVFFAAGAPVFAAPAAPRIFHSPPACIVRSSSGFPVVRAKVAFPNPTPGTVKIILPTRDGGFSELELAESGEAYEAVLPRPEAGAQELIYLLEASNGASETTTHPPFRIPIVEEPSECTGEAAPQSEGPPGVPVAEEEEKSKKRRGLWLALGAAAGAVAGLGFLSGGGEEATPPPEPPGPPPPPPPPPPPGPAQAPAEACFELPSSERVGVQVRMDASCSSPRGSLFYQWRLGDGRTREGRVINPIYDTPGLYTVELTVSRLTPVGDEGDVDRLEKPILIVASSPTPSPPAAPADIALSKTGALSSRIVDGVLEFHIAYTLQISNLGPGPADDVELVDPLAVDLRTTSVVASTGSCDVAGTVVTCRLGRLTAGAVATVRLDVDVRPGIPENTVVTNTATVQSATSDPSPSNNQATETMVLRRPSPLTAEAAAPISESVASFLSKLSSSRGDGSASGTVRVQESAVDVVNDRTSFHHRFRVRSFPEPIVVEAVVQRAPEESIWRFDFSSDSRFVLGSIEVLEGNVLGLESRTITFRLAGEPGERIRFSCRIRE